MPKKTRKEKILAQQRRSVPQIVSTNPKTHESTQPTQSTYQFQIPIDKKQQKIQEENSTELTAIQHDLYKTIFLAIGAFGIELYLYWLLK